MPTSDSQPGPFGLFRGGYDDQHMRVSDAERQAVADRLGEHYSDGRLDQSELDARLGQAMSAKTRGDLSGLFDDLPGSGLPGTGLPDTGARVSSPGGKPGAIAPAPYHRRRRHPVLAIALVVVLAVALAHAVAGGLIWLALVAFALVLTIGRARSFRPRYDSRADR